MLVACLAVTVLLLGTITTQTARAQERDGQMGGVVVHAGGQPLRVPQPTLRSVTIPSGTTLQVRLGQQLSTRTDRVGDTFSISLARSIVLDKETVMAEGTPLLGQIVELTPAWQTAEPLTLERRRSVKDHVIAGGICAATSGPKISCWLRSRNSHSS